MKLKTLWEIDIPFRGMKNIHPFEEDIRKEVIKWIKEFNKFTSQYCENEGNLSDDEVMAKMKKQHPEWEKEIKIDFSDDDLCKFYFLEDWLKYFFNIKQGDLK